MVFNFQFNIIKVAEYFVKLSHTISVWIYWKSCAYQNKTTNPLHFSGLFCYKLKKYGPAFSAVIWMTIYPLSFNKLFLDNPHPEKPPQKTTKTLTTTTETKQTNKKTY